MFYQAQTTSYGTLPTFVQTHSYIKLSTAQYTINRYFRRTALIATFYDVFVNTWQNIEKFVVYNVIERAH